MSSHQKTVAEYTTMKNILIEYVMQIKVKYNMVFSL